VYSKRKLLHETHITNVLATIWTVFPHKGPVELHVDNDEHK